MRSVDATLVPLLAERVAGWTGYRADAVPAGVLERVARDELARGATVESLLRRADAGDPELVQSVAKAVSVGETYFFRQPDHWRFLVHEVVPALWLAGVRDLRAWSAGCATGEEAFSLTATLAAAAPADMTFSVLGTDIVLGHLAFARRGRYSHRALRADAPLYPVFDPSGGSDLDVRSDLAAKTKFAPGNLLDAPPATAGRFHVIVCRNALVYFTAQAQRSALANLAGALATEGVLILGPMDALEPPPGLVPFGPAELQAFRRTERSATRGGRRSATRRRSAPARAPRPEPAPVVPRFDPVAAHIEALRAIDRGDDAHASSVLEGLARSAPGYVPGLLELALLVARPGATALARSLMRNVLRLTAGLPLDDEIAGPIVLPIRFYRDGARAFLDGHDS